MTGKQIGIIDGFPPLSAEIIKFIGRLEESLWTKHERHGEGGL